MAALHLTQLDEPTVASIVLQAQALKHPTVNSEAMAFAKSRTLHDATRLGNAIAHLADGVEGRRIVARIDALLLLNGLSRE